MNEKTLGLYIHIPFCKAKCAYCDFYSLAGADERMDAYLNALGVQLEAFAQNAAGYVVDTVYLGGGTPSYLGAARLRRILEAVRRDYRVAPDAEITVEANPGTLDAAKLTGKKLTIGYQNRQRPDSLYMKQEALNGTFGEIYYAKAIAIRRRAVPNWGVFLNEYEQGGGPLIDIGTHSLDLTLWMMNNYKPAICLGSTFKKMNREEEMYTNGKWDVNAFTVEDSAFGLVKMENGATISVESSWAINRSESIEAYTEFSGTKAGADMRGGVRIFGVRNGEWYVDVYPYDEYVAAMKTTLDHSDDPEEEIECVADAKQWIDALVTGKKPCVLPEQAYCVTRILEGIYESAKTGKAYIFD